MLYLIRTRNWIFLFKLLCLYVVSDQDQKLIFSNCCVCMLYLIRTRDWNFLFWTAVFVCCIWNLTLFFKLLCLYAVFDPDQQLNYFLTARTRFFLIFFLNCCVCMFFLIRTRNLSKTKKLLYLYVAFDQDQKLNKKNKCPQNTLLCLYLIFYQEQKMNAKQQQKHCRVCICKTVNNW